MGISIDSIWNKAQRLSASERLALSRKLRDSVIESDVERQERTASEIDRFFGGWNEDPRTTEEIMQQIREGRTANTFPHRSEYVHLQCGKVTQHIQPSQISCFAL